MGGFGPLKLMLVPALLVVAGCAQTPRAQIDPDTGLPVGAGPMMPAETEIDAPPPPANARTVDQFDTTSDADKQQAAAAPPSGGERELGRTIASLGDPTDPGFWAETPLVTAPVKGRLVYPATGKSVQVELRPSGGAAGSGSRVSLPALRVLEAPLTALPELIVFAGSSA